MSTPVLHVEHVTMQFGGVVAVNDLSMDVYDREIVALIGPNGAGKTTAFNCITGVYEPTNGRVDFLGEPIVCNHPHGKMKKIYAGEGAERYLDQRVVSYTPDVITKRGIARTFQNIRLFKSMTVFENVLTAMHVRRTSNVFSATFRLNAKEERAQRARALELLEIFWGVQLGKADVCGFDLPADGLGGRRLLLLAVDGDVMGMCTLGFYTSPTGRKAWMEDLVVDETCRGMHLGERLFNFAADFAEHEGYDTLMLTSRPARIAANRMYQKLGFGRKETNVYLKSKKPLPTLPVGEGLVSKSSERLREA